MSKTFRDTVTVQKGGLVAVRCPGAMAGDTASVSVEITTRPQSRSPQSGWSSISSSGPTTVRSDDLAAYVSNPKEYLFPEIAESEEPRVALSNENLELSRLKVETALQQSDFAHVETRVAYILQPYLDTRDDDIALLLRYFEVHQAEVLEGWDRGSLDILYSLDNVETIIRARRRVQNNYQMFVGTLSTRLRRKEISQQFYRYLCRKTEQDAEIRIYLDETKAEPGSRYAGVAGICVIDWRQYESSYLALKQWRDQTGWTETLHASPQAIHSIAKHLALLAEVKRRRAGLVFVGHDLAARALSSHTMVDLFVQMVMGCLQYLKQDGCLGRQRAVVLIKEADEGFDRAYGSSLESQLQQQIASEYPDVAYLKSVTPVKKGAEVMLEAADMIAFGMQRRAMYRGWSPRDELADAVANVTGFENSEARGVVYKAWYHA